MKVCRACGEAKSLTEFATDNRSPDGKQGKCRACSSAAMRAWRAKNPERDRSNQLRSLYGISAEEYDRMLAAQRGVCAICAGPCTTGRRLAVDHCHRTGIVRGLLCAMCNTAIGKMRDDPDLLRAAALYLEKHACHQSP